MLELAPLSFTTRIPAPIPVPDKRIDKIERPGNWPPPPPPPVIKDEPPKK